MDSSKALEKLKYFCSYQDRAHAEVKSKLGQLGVWGKDANEIMATLITEDYLNEERFARSFARGKFRMKHWGREKIIQALKVKNISAYCIRKGLEEIDENEYRSTMIKLAAGKYQSMQYEQPLKRQFKTHQYLIAKGYESKLAGEVVREIINS